MKLHLRTVLVFAALLICFEFKAQTTCETALPFCAGGVSGITFPASVNQPATQAV